MRKVTICFLIMLWSVIAFGQEPQWTVVKHVTLMQQNQKLLTTLLTPTEPSVYRLTIYFSGGTNFGRGFYEGTLNGLDISGQTLPDLEWIVGCNGGSYFSTLITSVLKPQVPLQFLVTSDDNYLATCQYNLAITVEQLVQQ